MKKYTLCLGSTTFEADTMAEAQHAYTYARDKYAKQCADEARAAALAMWPEAALLTGKGGHAGYVIDRKGVVRHSRSRRVVMR